MICLVLVKTSISYDRFKIVYNIVKLYGQVLSCNFINIIF